MLAWAAHLWPVGGSKHITSLERVWRVRDTVGHMTVLHVILCSVERGKAVFVKAFNTRYCWSYRNTDRGNSVILIKHTLNIIHFTFSKQTTYYICQNALNAQLDLPFPVWWMNQKQYQSLFLTHLTRQTDRTFLHKTGFKQLYFWDDNKMPLAECKRNRKRIYRNFVAC